MRVYVAGSSLQLDRVTAAMNAIEERGHEVTHDWCAEVRAVGHANPPEACLFDQLKWARDDLAGVSDADVFWLLMPTEGGFGAAVELGYAIAKGVTIIVSGGTPSRSIFTAFATAVYERDDQALEYFGELVDDGFEGDA